MTDMHCTLRLITTRTHTSLLDMMTASRLNYSELRDKVKSYQKYVPIKIDVTSFVGKEVNIKLRKLHKMCSRRNNDKQ